MSSYYGINTSREVLFHLFLLNAYKNIIFFFAKGKGFL